MKETVHSKGWDAWGATSSHMHGRKRHGPRAAASRGDVVIIGQPTAAIWPPSRAGIPSGEAVHW
jgi:hypothetical protein